MGLTSRWDNKTGALTLSGPRRRTVALTAGSTAATVGGMKAAALAVPVLKDSGEPVMALSDLLRLTGRACHGSCRGRRAGQGVTARLRMRERTRRHSAMGPFLASGEAAAPEAGKVQEVAAFPLDSPAASVIH